MKEGIERLRKRIKKQFETNFEVDENSDIPVHERYVKDEDVRILRKKKRIS